ncbi:MAG TPA: hypothetical protein VGH72_32145 [Pseudonocardia sp.]
MGGFAHARALRHRPPTGEFVRARMSRLLPPAVAMLTVWAVLAATLDVSGWPPGSSPPACTGSPCRCGSSACTCSSCWPRRR